MITKLKKICEYVNSNKYIIGEYKNDRFKEMFNSMYLNYEYNKICFYFNNEEITSIHLDKVISINKENNIITVKTNNYNITLTFFNTDIDLPDIDFNTDIEDIFNDYNNNKNEYNYILKREGEFFNICGLVYDTLNKDLMTIRLPHKSLIIVINHIKKTNQGWKINKYTEILKIKK